MMRRLVCISFLLCSFINGLEAQEYPVSILDGPALKVDSTSLRPAARPSVTPTFLSPSFPLVRNPMALMAPPEFETREQRAARINLRTYNSVMASVDQNLYWYRMPKIPKPWKQILGAARLFLSNPNGVPEGCVPLMNQSFPFIYAKIPGMAPFENPYTSDRIPRCIDTEYDFATGTYKQVMVDWSEVQKKMSVSDIPLSSRPIPPAPPTPAGR